MQSKFAGYSLRDFLPLRGQPRVSHHGRMTWEKLVKLITAGYGQGHFHNYKPWLPLRKRDYSPVSTTGHHPSPEMGHNQHYRSVGEKRLTLLIKWLGAQDARDQYPMWPWAHLHPAYGLPGMDHMKDGPGMLDIAREAGIAHGYYFGTDIPYVATVDLLSTWERQDGGYVLIAYAVKPFRVGKRSGGELQN